MDVTKAGTISGATTVEASLASVERDRTVYNLPDHTVKEPRVLIFTRQLPGGGDKEVLRTGLKSVYGDRNADGTARSGNIIIETTVRVPQDQDASLALAALVQHVGILRDTSIMDSNIEAGQIPYEA